jgi:hypothetical protein
VLSLALCASARVLPQIGQFYRLPKERQGMVSATFEGPWASRWYTTLPIS